MKNEIGVRASRLNVQPGRPHHERGTRLKIAVSDSDHFSKPAVARFPALIGLFGCPSVAMRVNAPLILPCFFLQALPASHQAAHSRTANTSPQPHCTPGITPRTVNSQPVPTVVIKIGAKNRIRRFHSDRDAELELWFMTSPLLCRLLGTPYTSLATTPPGNNAE
jgi:hypothetical protein